MNEINESTISLKNDASCKNALLLPIRLTVIYVLVSVLLYAFGPFDWSPQKPLLLYFLLFIYIFSLWAGYKFGIRQKIKCGGSFEWKDKCGHRAIELLTVLIVINYCIYVINIFRDYGMSSLNFMALFKQMAIGLQNPGLGYNLRYERFLSLTGTDVIGGSFMSLINYLWSFVRYPIIIFSMLYFKKLGYLGKTVTIAYMVTMFIFYYSIGTTIDVFHIFLLIELAPIINSFAKWAKGKITRKDVIKLVVSILIGFIIIGSYFMLMMLSRGGINDYDEPGYNIGQVELKEEITDSTDTDMADTDSHLKVPPIAMKFFISFSGYFTQGYHAVSQALDLDWTPMYGLGSNMFVVDFTTEHMYDIEQYTYQAKLEKAFGWESGVRWHSMYTWLANDVSFYGVPLIMFVIGFFFGIMFKDAIINDNLFAKVSIFYYMLMMFFIPCNNQIGQRADTLFSFAIIIIIWGISFYFRKKKGII